MILDWLAQTPALLVATSIVFVPGLAALFLFGMRGLALLAAAPLFGVASTAVIALLLGVTGIPWSPVSWGILTAALVGVAWGAGRLLGRNPPPVQGHPGRSRALAAGLIIGAAIGIWRLASYITDPAGISQTNDAVFHMNAVRFILETADASSLHITGVVGGDGFYPAAWHAIVSLVVMITGVDIPTAANMVTLVIGGLIWPMGIVWFTLRVTGSVQIAAYAGVFSAALQNFPLLMFQWGVLFPNALSTALIPAAVALVMSVPAWITATTRVRGAIRAALLLMVVVAALALSQPAALLAWAGFCVVWLTFRILAKSATLGRGRAIALTLLVWFALAGAWFVLSRGTSGSHWPPFRGKLEVFLDVLLNGHVLIPFAYAVSLLMIIGVVVSLRQRRLRWLVAAWGGVSVLYILVASIGQPLVRGVVLGPWYADPYRLAALAPIAVIPLAAIGADALAGIVARRMGSRPSGTRAVWLGLIGAAAFMLVLVLVRPVAMPAFLEGTYDRESRYLLAADSYLSPDERKLLENLDDLVEPGARVLGNPATGTGFGYMLSGVDVYPHNWSQPRTESWEVLAAHLRDAAEEPAVCDALADYENPEYVLDFGLGEDGPGRAELPGMTGFEGRTGFELVSSEHAASLWRITACDQ